MYQYRDAIELILTSKQLGLVSDYAKNFSLNTSNQEEGT